MKMVGANQAPSAKSVQSMVAAVGKSMVIKLLSDFTIALVVYEK